MNEFDNEVNNTTENNDDFSQSEYHFVPNKQDAFFSVNQENNNFSDQSIDTVQKVERKNRKFSFSAILISSVACAVVSAIVATILSSAFIFNKFFDTTDSPIENSQIENNNPNTSGNSTTIEITGITESVIEAVALKVNPSVVGIVTTEATTSFFGGSNETTGEGSGIIYSPNGYIITNYHVIESAVNSSKSNIKVYLSTNTEDGYDATIVGYNISYDLAVIKINAKNLPSVDLADSTQLKVGQYVAAVGSPGGLQFMGSVTFGIISGLNRVISDSSTGADLQLIQTDAAINPGNSGGALVNTKGELIGVNSSKIAATAYEGMGFAIPSNTVKEICDNIIAKENDPNPYIGITISEKYTAEILTQLGYPVGAVVKGVISGGPAEKSGIRSGDIIVEFNSIAITEYTVLTDEIAKCKPGNTVTVKIYRSGRYYSTSLKVGSNNSQ